LIESFFLQKRPPKTTFPDSNYSLSPSRVSSKEFVSAKSSFSNNSVDHYTESVVSNNQKDYFFELNQKDCFYKSGEKLREIEIEQDLKIHDKSCFGPCFGGENKTTIIELQEPKKKNEICHVFWMKSHVIYLIRIKRKANLWTYNLI